MDRRDGRDRGHRPQLSSDEERLINVAYETDLLQRRCDLALWLALYERAMVEVASLADCRRRRAIALAEYGRANIPNWDEEVRSFRDIAFISDNAYRFSLVLPTGEYGDDKLTIHYELRERRGVGVRFDGDWNQPPATTVRMPNRPSEAPLVAEDAIRGSMKILRSYQVQIPSPEDYAEPPPYQESEAERRDREILDEAARVRDEQYEARRKEERRADRAADRAAAGTHRRSVKRTAVTLGRK